MDNEGGEPAETPEPIVGAATETPTVAGRGFDWVAALAWGAAVVVALVLGGLAAIGFQSIGEQRHVIADWWKSATVEETRVVDLLPPQPTPERLPGLPPALSPGGAANRAADEDGKVVSNPVWVAAPQPIFPELAMRKGVEAGSVQLQCPVRADGTIPSCWILNETPAGAGFGQAALAGTVRARIKPRTVDGVATEGMIRFTVKFRLG
jgi:TonB family protein